MTAPLQPPLQPMEMRHPDRIGKYVVEEYLGGGMSHVYRAKDPLLGKTVAVKMLKAESSSDPESRSRFLREARMAANIDHPNIISVYDFGEHQGQPYMVMEFLKGDNLRTVIEESRTGDIANKLRIALQIAKALQYVHGQKIIHRDIKPENIHVYDSGVIKLMDFGIAKPEDLNLTRPGFTMGTPYYMAPEQIQGKEVTCLADVYAYGILLFEVFAGFRPITGENVEQVFFKILQEPIDLKPLQQAAIPESIVNLINACTAKDPLRRPQDFSKICPGLEREIGAIEGRAKPSPPPRPFLHDRRLLLVLLSVLMISIGVGLLLAHFLKNSSSSARTDTTVGPESPALKPVLPAVLPDPSGEMVFIPAGDFLSGPDKQRDYLPDFYMDRAEVTNDAYRQFCMARGIALPAGFDKAHPDFPVVNITIDDARQFAAWAGKQLPNVKQWEKAARGKDGLEYPWGNNANPANANVNSKSLVSVNAFSSGESPFHVLQTVGNAWEFVDELTTPSPRAIEDFTTREKLQPAPTKDEPWYTIMGESYENELLRGVTYDTASVPARFHSPSIGFRCVKIPR